MKRREGTSRWYLHSPNQVEGTTPESEVRCILDRLAQRFSCRDFDGSEIDAEELLQIVTDGVEAPSSCNQQNWHFIIVTDCERKRQARETSGGNHHFEFCSAIIYLCFQKGWTHGNFSIVQSVAGACYHMMLSAHLRGYQCIWNAGIGDPDALRAMLDLPQNFEVQGALAIGRAKPEAPAIKAPRRPVDEIHSWERFDRPACSIYPVKPADSYPFFEIRNNDNPFAQWNPQAWTWAQIADFRGYSVWAKSPLAGVYVSRRQGDAQKVEHSILPELLSGHVVEVMPWGGTSTVALHSAVPEGCRLSIVELSKHNLTFIAERLKLEGLATDHVGFDLMSDGTLPYGDASVDTLVLPQVLEHVPVPQALLGEAARVLKTGGHLVISVRNMSSEYGAHWRKVESLAQVPNQGPFTPLPASEVRSWLSSLFVIEEELGIGRSATGDAAVLTGDESLTGRLYAARARRE